MEINQENCKPFGNGRKVMKLWIITLQVQFKKKNEENKQTDKQTNKQNNLLALTVSCQKRSCLIRRKKKKTKTKIIIIIIIIIIIMTKKPYMKSCPMQKNRLRFEASFRTIPFIIIEMLNG